MYLYTSVRGWLWKFLCCVIIMNVSISENGHSHFNVSVAICIALNIYPARAQSAWAQRACALRALGLLLADGALTVRRGKTF